MKSKQINEILFCVPVWGDSYVTKFLNFVLPSYFTKDNLGALRKTYKIRFCVLSDKKGFRKIRLNDSFKNNLRKGEFSFINIEDLIVDSQYTFTLTMAYARAINSINSTNLGKTLVILANSDFLLSDGSIASILQAAESGAQAIYGASLRCKYEEVAQVLRKKKSKEFYSSRNLVHLTLNSLHPTVTAMTVNNGYQHYRNVRQLFYRVDETCLLARNFLLCIIGIVPQKHLDEVNSYHDYSFVPELTNEQARYTITDSDHYFAMELQDENSESEYISFGELDGYEIAKAINLWAMPEHRWASKNQIIFHSGKLPKHIKDCQSNFLSFYSSIETKLSKNPLSHINHYHWTSGALIWEQKAKILFGSDTSLRKLSPTVRKISFFDRLNAIRFYPISFYKIAKRIFYSKLSSAIAKPHLRIAYYSEYEYLSSLREESNLRGTNIDINRIQAQKADIKFHNPIKVSQLNFSLTTLIEDQDIEKMDLIISRSSVNWQEEDKIMLDFLNVKKLNSNFDISSNIEGRFLIVIFRSLISKFKSFVLRGRYFRWFRLLLALLPISLFYVGILACNILPIVPSMKRQKGSFVHICLTKR